MSVFERMSARDYMTGCQVVPECLCRKRYPRVSHVNDLIHPGRMVPQWAIEVVEVFERAGYLKFAQRVNRILMRVHDDARRAELARALMAMASLKSPSIVGPDTALPGRCVSMIADYLVEHSFKPLTENESIELDVAMLT